MLRFTFLLLLLSAGSFVSAQTILRGTVFDITKKTPVEAVSVITTSGKGTTTDSLGRYTIVVKETDSIYFSFLNKPTPKYAVKNIQNFDAFDISILMKLQELPSVMVRSKNYRMDSIQNRIDYAKVFDFRKPGIKTSTLSTPGSFGVGVDLNELINMFKFRKNRSMLAFQKRLMAEERDKYINHRFNKPFIRKLTGLNGEALDEFIANFKPTYTMIVQLNDIELGKFIQEAYVYYKKGIRVNRALLREDE